MGFLWLLALGRGAVLPSQHPGRACGWAFHLQRDPLSFGACVQCFAVRDRLAVLTAVSAVWVPGAMEAMVAAWKCSLLRFLGSHRLLFSSLFSCSLYSLYSDSRNSSNSSWGPCWHNFLYPGGMCAIGFAHCRQGGWADLSFIVTFFCLRLS